MIASKPLKVFMFLAFFAQKASYDSGVSDEFIRETSNREKGNDFFSSLLVLSN